MKNLFVANMSFQTAERELTALFEGFGQVTRVHVPLDRETGRTRGFAFVEMPNDDEAAKAITGRIHKVNEPRPKAERTAQRRGRSGGRRPSRFSTEDYCEAARQPRQHR